MSTRSKLVAKARFRVLRAVSEGNYEPADCSWRDYFGRSFTYMDACEKAERLRGEGGAYAFKVTHEKLVGTEK